MEGSCNSGLRKENFNIRTLYKSLISQTTWLSSWQRSETLFFHHANLRVFLHKLVCKKGWNSFFSISWWYSSCAISSCLTRPYQRILYYIFCRILMEPVYKKILNKCYITMVPVESGARTSTKKLAQCPRKSRTDCSIGKKTTVNIL